VFNEETVIAVGYLILFSYIAKVRPSLLSMCPVTPGLVYANFRGCESKKSHT
jgi:hypothetical protein